MSEVVCTACLGKKQLSIYGEVFDGNKVLPMGIHMVDCGKCKGTGLEPVTEQTKESIILFSKTLNTPVEAWKFRLEDIVSGHHVQDCCESVYIDFEHVDAQRMEINELGTITKVEIATAPEEGIIVNLYNGERDMFAYNRVSVFLACRNQQNGYYSDDLTLRVDVEGEVIEFELQALGAVKNEID